MKIFLDILMLLFLDIILSVDNAILIASTTKELDDKSRRWAQIIGASLAVLLRLVFVILVMLVLTQFAAVPTLYILGGLALVVIGILITKDSSESHDESKSANSILKAVAMIMAGDIMLSFDNAFVIADISMGMELTLGWTILIIAIALLLSLIILLFFSNQLSLLMRNNPWMIYIAGWLLVSVGIELMLKDSLFGIDEKYHLLCMLGAYALGGVIVSCKWLIFDKKKENTQN